MTARELECNDRPDWRRWILRCFPKQARQANTEQALRAVAVVLAELAGHRDGMPAFTDRHEGPSGHRVTPAAATSSDLLSSGHRSQQAGLHLGQTRHAAGECPNGPSGQVPKKRLSEAARVEKSPAAAAAPRVSVSSFQLKSAEATHVRG
ncbi:unnamed protein product [Symbiodinium sp. CCMP2456]|nr:unnamed protein product [Symbiodinium sp. CCMP2456]